MHKTKTQGDGEELTTLGQEDLLPYREYSNLTALPIGSTNKVSAIGYAKSYGGERLVIKIVDTFYQAGDDVENKVDQLKLDSILKIKKSAVIQVDVPNVLFVPSTNQEIGQLALTFQRH